MQKIASKGAHKSPLHRQRESRHLLQCPIRERRSKDRQRLAVRREDEDHRPHVIIGKNHETGGASLVLRFWFSSSSTCGLDKAAPQTKWNH
mmetsp:Transcript_5501/g.9961  ORF Transcript_5501/g.9961 Transcript_5501/m.9961 type:complete len:91 (+) Transcript_5501:1014-1286(+)